MEDSKHSTNRQPFIWLMPILDNAHHRASEEEVASIRRRKGPHQSINRYKSIFLKEFTGEWQTDEVAIDIWVSCSAPLLYISRQLSSLSFSFSPFHVLLSLSLNLYAFLMHLRGKSRKLNCQIALSTYHPFWKCPCCWKLRRPPFLPMIFKIPCRMPPTKISTPISTLYASHKKKKKKREKMDIDVALRVYCLE